MTTPLTSSLTSTLELQLPSSLRWLADGVVAPPLPPARRAVRRRLQTLLRRRRARRLVGHGALAATVVTGGLRLRAQDDGPPAEAFAQPLVEGQTEPAVETEPVRPLPPVIAPAPTLPEDTEPAAPTLTALTDRDHTVADPAAVWAEDRFHIYATSTPACDPDAGDGGTCAHHWVPRFTTTSLDTPASLQGDALPQRPRWVDPDEREIWAPSVARIGDAYVMYFAATAGGGPFAGLKCLGVAVAPTPAGPFLPHPEPLRCSSGYWNIDPEAVADETGWYLLWRQDDRAHPTGKIVAARLARTGLAIVGPEHTLVEGEHPWEDGYPDGTRRRHVGPIENPALARHPATGEWILTWSANRWETARYATGLASCAGPLGPCQRISQQTPWLRTSCDGPVTGAPVVGMGGLSFVTGPDGRLHAVLHGYRSASCDGHPESARLGWTFPLAQPPETG